VCVCVCVCVCDPLSNTKRSHSLHQMLLQEVNSGNFDL